MEEGHHHGSNHDVELPNIMVDLTCAQYFIYKRPNHTESSRCAKTYYISLEKYDRECSQQHLIKLLHPRFSKQN